MSSSRFRVPVGFYKATPKERAGILRVLASGQISPGPAVCAFEERFARMHGCAYGVMLNSGTSALRIALACLKEMHHWKDGDEVLVPAVTFVATANVVLQNGLTPVFVDIDKRTYNINPVEIEKHITRRTRAIIPVHLFGQPCDMASVARIARKRHIRVIEDSCESMFVGYRGKSVGSFGDIACFSTYAAHLLNTGVGGVAVTNNKTIAIMLRSLANHGRDAVYIPGRTPVRANKKTASMIIARRFRFVRLGYSFRATEFQAALGLAQLEQKDKMLSRRQAIARLISRGLAPYADHLQLPYTDPNAEHAFMMYPIVVKNPRMSKKRLVEYLERRGIETRDMLPLINQPVYVKHFGNLEKKYPVARWINNKGFYVGCHHGLTNGDVRYMLDVFASYFLKKRHS